MVLQHIYMPILNFIYEKFTYRFPEKLKGHIFAICFFMIFSLQLLSQYILGYEVISRFDRDISICFLLGIVIVLSVNDKLKILQWRKSVYIPYTLAGILILIAAFDHVFGPGHSYQAFPLVMLVGFVCLFYVWGNRRDYETLFKAVALGYLAFAVIVAVVCFLKYPYYEFLLKGGVNEYAPFDINPNGVAKIVLPGVASGIYLFYINIEKKTKYLYAAAAGACLAIIWLTRCRSAYIILILFVAIVALLIFKSARNIETKYISKALVVLLCILLVTTIFFQFLLKSVSPIFYEAIEGESVTYIEKDDDKGDSEEQNQTAVKIDPEKQVYLDEGYANIVDNDILLKLNEFTSGRIAIWSVYFDRMSWFGEEERLFDRTEYAHNQYIELSYKAGIPVGPLYLLFVLVVGLITVRDFLNKEKHREYTLFQLLVFCMFFVISMLDTGIIPMERAFILMFYIVSAPCFFVEK